MHWNVQNLRALVYFPWAKTCSEHADSLLVFQKSGKCNVES